MQVILYNQDDGIPAYIMPTNNAVLQFGIEAIAKKDVPFGKSYKIIDASELPNDPQEQWEVDEADLTDGIGADYGAGSVWEVINMNPLTVRHAETSEIKEVTE
jgi:hypothetical protein